MLSMALVGAPTALRAQPGASNTPSTDSERRAPITVVIQSDSDEAANAVRNAARRAVLPISLRFAEAPHPPTTASDDGEAATFAAARTAYVDADFEACLDAIGATTRIDDALGAGRREVAARLAFWRATCSFAAGDHATAHQVAERMATMRLPIPAEVELASPTLERLLADTYARAAALPTVEARVEASRPGAVLVDGLDRCATPCSLSLPPGDHVIRFEGPGSTPLHVTARFPREPLELRPTEASPTLAGEQWSARIAGGADLEDRISLRLLARAVRARHLVLLSYEAPALRGALVIDGRITRAARDGSLDGSLDTAVEPLLRELLVEGRVIEPPPPLWRRAGFWIGVVLTAAAAATVATLLARDPPTRTEVGF